MRFSQFLVGQTLVLLLAACGSSGVAPSDVADDDLNNPNAFVADLAVGGVGAKIINRSIQAAVSSVAATNDGGVVVAGNGPDSTFVVRYDAEGKRKWTRYLGTAAGFAAAVAVDDDKNLYVTDTVPIGLCKDTASPNIAGSVLYKLSPNGKTLWSKKICGDFNQMAAAISPSGQLLLYGYALAANSFCTTPLTNQTPEVGVEPQSPPPPIKIYRYFWTAYSLEGHQR